MNHLDRSFQGTQEYVASEQLLNAVNVAITLQKPLLIKGEPGTGKTMLVEAIAKSLNKNMHGEYTVNLENIRKLYEYDFLN